MEDAQMMEEVKEGKIEKLAVLFEKYHVRLYNYFLRLTLNQGASEDLVQEVFIRILKKPMGADLVLAKNQERLPHIIAGKLPFETGADTSNEVSSGALLVARKSVFSISGLIEATTHPSLKLGHHTGCMAGYRKTPLLNYVIV